MNQLVSTFDLSVFWGLEVGKAAESLYQTTVWLSTVNYKQNETKIISINIIGNQSKNRVLRIVGELQLITYKHKCYER
jgi:hypothetical protein